MVEAHSTLFMSAAAVSSDRPAGGYDGQPPVRVDSERHARAESRRPPPSGRSLGSRSAPSATGSVPGAERVSSVLFVGTPAPSIASPSV